MGRPRSNNPQIGTCVCPLCDEAGARVHQQGKSTVNQFMYYFCDNCGCIQPTRSEKGQEAIKETFEPLDADSVPDWYLKRVPVEVPKPDEVPVPEPVPSKNGFLDGWGDDDA